MKGIIISLFMALLSGITAHAQTWVSLDGSKEGRSLTSEILESDANIHKVKITLHGFSDRIIAENGTQYHLLSIRGDHASELMSEGEPQLPTITQLIAIPEGATYSLSVKDEKWQDVEMGTVYPAQRDSKDNDPAPGFVINESVYGQELYAPEILKWGTEQNWCHIRCFGLRVCPFRYYPLQDKLSVLTEFVLQIDFTGVSDNSPVRLDDLRRAVDWHMFDNDISSFPVMSDMARSSSDDYDYLIIVGNTPSIINSQALKDFKRWKAFKGYKTKVVSTATTGTTASSIKSYIAQEYSSSHIKYVLLIGDYDKIPSQYFDFYNYDPSIWNYFDSSDTVKSDYWYGCLDANYDYSAELPIGRFSTNSLSEFTNMIQKTIDYEKSFNGDYQKVLLVAHKEGAPGKYQECCDSILSAHNASMQFSTAYGADESFEGNEATNNDVINFINSGMHIVNYRGHGETTHWGIETLIYGNKRWNIANELFEASLINSIASNSLYFNVCCMTGNYYYGTCMMETFMRSPKGAIACLAASKDIYTNASHEYDKKLFSTLLNHNVFHIGDLNLQAHLATITNYFPRAAFNAYASVCGGDPTLEIWTATPSSYQNVEISEQNGNIIVSSNSFTYNDTISVVSENDELIYKYPVSGTSCSFPTPSGNFYLAVNRHNHYPYIAHYHTADYIQNEMIDVNAYYAGAPLNIGYDVTTGIPYGNVTVKSGSKLSIKNGAGGVTIKNGFECENGAEMTIE